LDAYGNFNTTEKWSCREVQPNFVPIWFPNETTGLNQTCWSDNTSVHLGQDSAGNGLIRNAEGLTSTTTEGPTQNYETSAYDVLLKAFNAMGYVYGSSLFCTSYDFRLICSPDKLAEFSLFMTNLIENSVRANGRRAVLVCHGLGCVLMNFLLANAPQEWKDTFIESFVMFSASFGGCPKALRVLLSGEALPSKNEQRIIRDTTTNFTGLQWMLPRPEIYGSQNLVQYRQANYTAYDIPKLLETGLGPETAEIFKSVVTPINTKSLEAPGVRVYVLAGINVQTESSYVYSDLNSDPVKNYPFYKSDQANQQQATFPDNYSGDGTMPRAALEYPLKWAAVQKEPVHFRFYDGYEHTLILSKSESVKDLLEVIKQLNSN